MLMDPRVEPEDDGEGDVMPHSMRHP
jgi:hypothetical protein